MGWSLVYYTALLVAASARGGWVLESLAGMAGNLAARLLAAVAGLSIALAASGPRNEITFLTDRSALIVDHGQTILIDGGSSPSVLLRLGSALPFPNGRLDAVIDTDPRAANVASLMDVTQHVPVGVVVDPGIEYPSQTYARWRASLSGKGIRVLAMRPGLAVRCGSLTLHVLAPDGVYPNPKDGAGAVMITAGRERILYLGPDSSREQEDMPFGIGVRAGTVIASVPLSPVLREATGERRLVSPLAGHSMPLP